MTWRFESDREVIGGALLEMPGLLTVDGDVLEWVMRSCWVWLAYDGGKLIGYAMLSHHHHGQQLHFGRMPGIGVRLALRAGRQWLDTICPVSRAYIITRRDEAARFARLLRIRTFQRKGVHYGAWWKQF